jgi:hypothetical protein
MISDAPNREDVVLWRVFRGVDGGRYVEITADDGRRGSVTRLLADRGWTGLVLVPDADVAAARRETRPHEEIVVVPDGAGAAGPPRTTPVGDVHLLVVRGSDWQGALAGSDPAVLDPRPWVVVVTGLEADPASAPNRWDAELVAAGYQRCLFDGVAQFYLAPEHDEYRPLLSYPACPRDEFVDRREADLADEVARLEAAVRQAHDEALDEVLRWRHAAVTTWAKTAAARSSGPSPKEYQQLQVALAAAQRDAAEVRQTLSWRVTKPLRMAKSAGRR